MPRRPSTAGQMDAAIESAASSTPSSRCMGRKMGSTRGRSWRRTVVQDVLFEKPEEEEKQQQSEEDDDVQEEGGAQVSRGAGSGSNTMVFSSKKSAGKQSFITTSTPRKKGTKKVAKRLKESLMELEGRGPHTPQLSRNLEMNVNEGTNQELLSIEPPPGFKSICTEQSFLDGEHVDEQPIHIGSSECTMNNTPLRSCSVVGSSLCSTLPSSHISGEQSSFMKSSDVLHLIEKTMEVFRKAPQRPHFRPLEKHAPELREGIAIGLKIGYANLVDSVKNSSIEDSIASFEGKISALTILEENGFEVKSLRHILNKLLEAKLDHRKHVGHLDKLKELVPRKESTVSQKHALLNEKERTEFQLQQKLDSIRREAEQIARERENQDAELLRLKAEVNATQEACSDGELRFHRILAEVRSRLQLSDKCSFRLTCAQAGP